MLYDKVVPDPIKLVTGDFTRFSNLRFVFLDSERGD